MPCSACGLSKRHLFDEAARDGGYDVVVTGHNLDDEAAVLFGNTLRWDVEYLGRQLPVLPARDGFPKKVKPLMRLTERETAAWCIVRGIDYQVEECPMAAGNKHLAYKAALNAIERESPGSKAAFYLNFVERMAPLLAGATQAAAGELRACSRCAARRRLARCARSAARGARRRSSAGARRRRARPHPPARTSSWRRGVKPLEYGERVMLLDAKKRRYLITLAEGGEFHSHAGFVPHSEIAGQQEGVVVRSTRGAEYTVLRPTLEDYVIEMPRGAQVDLSEGPRTDLHAGRHRPRHARVRDRHRVGGAVDDDAALGGDDRRLRDPRDTEVELLRSGEMGHTGHKRVPERPIIGPFGEGSIDGGVVDGRLALKSIGGDGQALPWIPV